MGSRATLALLIMFALWRTAAFAQPTPCDAAVATIGSDPARYQLRDGTRCEGVFVQNVAGSSSLRVASLTLRYDPFSDTSRRPLRVAWTAPEHTPVRLRAYSLRSGLHYRMETVAPLIGGTYTWPTTVLQSLRMKKGDLGVVAVARMAVGDSVQDVHLPVRIQQAESPQGAASLRFILWSATGLSRVFVGVDALDAGGLPARVVQKSTELGYGVYPAARAIPIPLSSLGAKGIYRVRIGAVRQGGGSSTTTFLLFHAGP